MFETERLRFRKFTLDDLPLLIDQRSDPEVNKYLGGEKRQNPEALAERIRFYIDCYEKFGFGTCAMIWKETGEVIGSAGIQPLENTGEVEVAYNMIRRFWGKGIGTEAAKGWLQFGFETAELDRIVAIAIPENKSSIRIMKKIGMTYEATEYHYDLECARYSILRERFLENRL